MSWSLLGWLKGLGRSNDGYNISQAPANFKLPAVPPKGPPPIQGRFVVTETKWRTHTVYKGGAERTDCLHRHDHPGAEGSVPLAQSQRQELRLHRPCPLRNRRGDAGRGAQADRAAQAKAQQTPQAKPQREADSGAAGQPGERPPLVPEVPEKASESRLQTVHVLPCLTA